jgi:hypothetical protein
MKRVLLISLAVAFCVTACGEKSQLQLKARQMKEGQPKAGPGSNGNSSEKTGDDKEDGILNMPTNTNNRKILVNGNATRNVIIGGDSMTTTVFCTENLAKSQNEKERIKIQGKSQIILRQVVTMEIPEATLPSGRNNTTKEAPKTLVSFACVGGSADLDKEPADQDITTVKLVPGKNITSAGRFSSVVADHENKAVIACVTAKDMAKANDLLLPEDSSKAADILMASNSKILVQTSSKDKDIKKYILVTCDEPTP